MVRRCISFAHFECHSPTVVLKPYIANPGRQKGYLLTKFFLHHVSGWLTKFHLKRSCLHHAFNPPTNSARALVVRHSTKSSSDNEIPNFSSRSSNNVNDATDASPAS